MPVSKDDFSAFDEAVKAAKTTTSRTEDDFSAFDEAVKKKRKPSVLSNQFLKIQEIKNSLSLRFKR
jgi:hypothetical protein